LHFQVVQPHTPIYIGELSLREFKPIVRQSLTGIEVRTSRVAFFVEITRLFRLCTLHGFTNWCIGFLIG
jgi:hypothetical protein